MTFKTVKMGLLKFWLKAKDHLILILTEITSNVFHFKNLIISSKQNT